jgi:hypothetical protein
MLNCSAMIIMALITMPMLMSYTASSEEPLQNEEK